MRLSMLLTLSLLLSPCLAQAHQGGDGGFHHSLPMLLVWLPFVRAMYQAGWKTCLKALLNYMGGA